MAVATQPSMVAQLQNFGQLTPSQKFGFLIAGAAIVTLFFVGYLWYQTPTYQVLYTNLSDKDGGAAINALSQMNVPFKTEGTSIIKVPIDKVYEVRLKLAAQGIPKGGAGFDLLDNQKFGVSQFVEQVNYQRALEGELTRTIEAISVVQGARVHLAIPRPSVFLRDQQKPSASVFLSLGGGKRLDASQISGIVHLVSSSVPGMPTQNVTVVDQNGNLLMSPDQRGKQAGLDPSQLDYLHQIESSYVKRIESIIAPIVGAANVRAQVTAELDFAQTEQTSELYKPNPVPQESAIRSQHTSESAGGAGSGAGGVPGALSNQPPGAATAPITGPAGAGAAGAAAEASGGGSARESTVNYELDKTIRHTKQPVGSVKRLSAAVVVNYKKSVAQDGKVSYKPLTAQELTQVNNLVKEAMGFSQQRGDSLNVVNTAFNIPEAEQVEAAAFYENPRLQAMGIGALKFILIAAVIWFLVFRVLMPILRELATPPPPPPMPELMMETAAGGAAPARHGAYEDNLQAVRQLAQQDPKVVANVVKEWVGGE